MSLGLVSLRKFLAGHTSITITVGHLLRGVFVIAVCFFLLIYLLFPTSLNSPLLGLKQASFPLLFSL